MFGGSLARARQEAPSGTLRSTPALKWPAQTTTPSPYVVCLRMSPHTPSPRVSPPGAAQEHPSLQPRRPRRTPPISGLRAAGSDLWPRFLLLNVRAAPLPRHGVNANHRLFAGSPSRPSVSSGSPPQPVSWEVSVSWRSSARLAYTCRDCRASVHGLPARLTYCLDSLSLSTARRPGVLTRWHRLTPIANPDIFSCTRLYRSCVSFLALARCSHPVHVPTFCAV